MAINSSFAAQLHACALALFQLLERFSKARVLVVGDLTLDEFLTGHGCWRYGGCGVDAGLNSWGVFLGGSCFGKFGSKHCGTAVWYDDDNAI